MDKSRVLAAIETNSLRRVIEHLLAGCDEVSLTTFRGNARKLARHAARNRPAVIVADYSRLGHDPAGTIAAIRDANPHTKLVVIDPFAWRHARAGDVHADVCLRKSAVASRLAPTVQRLARMGKRQLPGGIQ